MPIAAFTPTLDKNPGKTVNVSRGRVKPKSKDPSAYNIGTSQAFAWELRKLSGICLLDAARPRLFSTESVSGMCHGPSPKRILRAVIDCGKTRRLRNSAAGLEEQNNFASPSRRRAFDPETLWL